MNAQEFTVKRRQTVRLPDSSEFVIRRIGVMDVLIAGGNPDLSIFTKGKSPAERLRAFADESAETLKRIQKDIGAQRKFCESVILRGVVSPKIVGAAPCGRPTEGAHTGAPLQTEGIDLADLTFEECDCLAGAILKFSGFTKEAAEQVGPLSASGDGSKASTPLHNATGSVPVNLPTLSEVKGSEVSSKPTPSTSPAPAPAGSENERSLSA